MPEIPTCTYNTSQSSICVFTTLGAGTADIKFRVVIKQYELLSGPSEAEPECLVGNKPNIEGSLQKGESIGQFRRVGTFGSLRRTRSNEHEEGLRTPTPLCSQEVLVC